MPWGAIPRRQWAAVWLAVRAAVVIVGSGRGIHELIEPLWLGGSGVEVIGHPVGFAGAALWGLEHSGSLEHGNHFCRVKALGDFLLKDVGEYQILAALMFALQVSGGARAVAWLEQPARSDAVETVEPVGGKKCLRLLDDAGIFMFGLAASA